MLTASSIDRWQAILFAYNSMDVYLCAIVFRIILNLNVNTATSFQIKNWQIIDNISIHRRRKNIAHVSCVDSWFFSWFFVKFSRLEYTFRHQNGKVLTIVRMTTAATSIDFFCRVLWRVCMMSRKPLICTFRAIYTYVVWWVATRLLACFDTLHFCFR